MDGSTFFVIMFYPSEPRTKSRSMKNNWDSMLNIAQEAVEKGEVNCELLKNLREQATHAAEYDSVHLPVIQLLHNMAIGDDMVEKMSQCKSGQELILRFYEELQNGFPEEQKFLLADIFSEVTKKKKKQR